MKKIILTTLIISLLLTGVVYAKKNKVEAKDEKIYSVKPDKVKIFKKEKLTLAEFYEIRDEIIKAEKEYKNGSLKVNIKDHKGKIIKIYNSSKKSKK